MLPLPPKATLIDLQRYVDKMEAERGFKAQSPLHTSLLLGEEVGELFKAVRKQEADLRIDPHSQTSSVEEELADILIYVCSLANKYGIGLEQAFRNKEKINNMRVWK